MVKCTCLLSQQRKQFTREVSYFGLINFKNFIKTALLYFLPLKVTFN